jgi:hypothetical protein
MRVSEERGRLEHRFFDETPVHDYLPHARQPVPLRSVDGLDFVIQAKDVLPLFRVNVLAVFVGGR